jgi:hypothetical protein
MNELPDQLPNLSSLSHEQKDEIIRMLFPLIAEVRRLSARLSKQPQFQGRHLAANECDAPRNLVNCRIALKPTFTNGGKKISLRRRCAVTVLLHCAMHFTIWAGGRNSQINLAVTIAKHAMLQSQLLSSTSQSSVTLEPDRQAASDFVPGFAMSARSSRSASQIAVD